MKKNIGWIITATLIFYLLSVVFPFLLPVPMLLAWAVPFIHWPRLGKGARKQALVLIMAGVGLLSISAYKGVFLGWEKMLSGNIPLLAMFVAVSFLSLASSSMAGENLPKGKKAVATTAVATHVLAGIINLSALFVFGDRLQKNGRLTATQMIILGRSFCAAAWWSPFFIATGVALTYSPGMSLQKTLIPGGIMSAAALFISIVEVGHFRKEVFHGYPFKVESLTIPIFLAVLALGAHYLSPDINILNLICIISPAGAIIFMKSRPRVASIQNFITNKMDSVSSQFALFLSAGIFSSGVKSMAYTYPALFSLENYSFTPLLFAAVLGAMILAGIIGVHPVISISIVSPLLLPLNMDPSQLGFLFLSSWAISTASSPLSGIGLALVGRYRAAPGVIIRSNWHYAIIMWALASLANMYFFTRIFSI